MFQETQTAEERKSVKDFVTDVRCIFPEFSDGCTMNSIKSFVMGASFSSQDSSPVQKSVPTLTRLRVLFFR